MKRKAACEVKKVYEQFSKEKLVKEEHSDAESGEELGLQWFILLNSFNIQYGYHLRESGLWKMFSRFAVRYYIAFF